MSQQAKEGIRMNVHVGAEPQPTYFIQRIENRGADAVVTMVIDIVLMPEMMDLMDAFQRISRDSVRRLVLNRVQSIAGGCKNNEAIGARC